MTAINVVVEDDRVHVITDGAAIGPSGELVRLAQKALPLAHLNAVLAVRGQSGLAGMMLEVVTSFGAQSFDDLRVRMADGLQVVLGAAAASGDTPIDFVIAGVSETDGPTCYVVPTHDGHELPAFERADFPRGVMMPASDELFELVEQVIASGSELDEVAVRVIDAQRAFNGSSAGVPAGTCLVGCFVQITTVHRDCITTRIVRRWPDPVGQPLSPTPPSAPFEFRPSPEAVPSVPDRPY